MFGGDGRRAISEYYNSSSLRNFLGFLSKTWMAKFHLSISFKLSKLFSFTYASMWMLLFYYERSEEEKAVLSEKQARTENLLKICSRYIALYCILSVLDNEFMQRRSFVSFTIYTGVYSVIIYILALLDQIHQFRSTLHITNSYILWTFKFLISILDWKYCWNKICP